MTAVGRVHIKARISLVLQHQCLGVDEVTAALSLLPGWLCLSFFVCLFVWFLIRELHPWSLSSSITWFKSNRSGPQAEALRVGGVGEAIHRHGRLGGMECLPNALVELVVGDGAPEGRLAVGDGLQV